MYRMIVFAFSALSFLPREVFPTNYPTVFWTPNNCRFKLNKRNGKGYSFKVKAMSKMVFMCPHVAIWAGKSEVDVRMGMMHENVFVVDKESYESCSIKNTKQFKPLLKCDSSPEDHIKYTEEYFWKDQADKSKMRYSVGKDYYFISTSNGQASSLNNTEGGHCKTHHMKLHIYVCNETEPCEFKNPECPKDTDEDSNEIDTMSNHPTCNNNTVKVAGRSDWKSWFSDNRHPVFYSLMGLTIVFLIVVIFWLVHINRSYRKSCQTSKYKK